MRSALKRTHSWLAAIRSNTAQNTFALWLAYLVFLVAMHVVGPNDAWAAMFYPPWVLLLAPLAVASIPLLMPRVKQSADEDFAGERQPTRTDTLRRMAMTWLAALVVFGSPHGPQGTTLTSMMDPVLHRPAFLIFAPLLLAFLPVLIPVPVRAKRPSISAPVQSRAQTWKGLVSGGIMAVILVISLLVLNQPDFLPENGSKLMPNAVLGLFLVGDLWAMRKFVKDLRRTK